MRLGIRLLFAFFLINGIAAFFVLRVFTAEIKPSVREVMEDMMVDTANILAERRATTWPPADWVPPRPARPRAASRSTCANTRAARSMPRSGG